MTKYLDEIIKICYEYDEIARNVPRKMSLIGGIMVAKYAEKLKALGFEFGEDINAISDLSIIKGYRLENSATKHKPNMEEYYVIWSNGRKGVLQFAENCNDLDVFEIINALSPIYKDFIEKLMCYNPLNYDHSNCVIVYDAKSGGKLMRDYPKIVEKAQKLADKKLKELKLAHLREECDELQKELEKEEES